MGKSTINIYKWPFSIAMLVYQRVTADSGVPGKAAATSSVAKQSAAHVGSCGIPEVVE